MHVKRWAALFLFGTVLTGLAVAMGLVYSYRYVPFPEPVSGLVQVITLQFLPRELRFLSTDRGLVVLRPDVTRPGRSS
jgi:hypothetical protein